MTRKYRPETVWPNAILEPSRPAPIFAGFLQNLHHFLFIYLVVVDVRQTSRRIDIESRLQAP
jgi:hypothetical protein